MKKEIIKSSIVASTLLALQIESAPIFIHNVALVCFRCHALSILLLHATVCAAWYITNVTTVHASANRVRSAAGTTSWLPPVTEVLKQHGALNNAMLVSLNPI